MDTTNNRAKYKSARDEIEAYGFIQPFAVRRGPYIFMGIIAALGLVLVVVTQLTPYGQEGSRIATVIIALGALMLGYQQWRAARNEVSMDKFYERLDKADQRLEDWPSARAMLSHFWQGATDQASYERFNYVYVELDNLEYVIEKYKLGYISPDQALRGLRTFRSRCLSPEFRTLASQFTHNLEDAGYQSTTTEVVKRVCSDPGFANSVTQQMPSVTK